MRTEFTPAPWLIDQNSSGFVYALNKEGINQFWLKISSQPKCATENEINANASLIAAAPDMFTALEQALAVLSGERMSKQSLIDALTLATLALKKAKGQMR